MYVGENHAPQPSAKALGKRKMEYDSAGNAITPMLPTHAPPPVLMPVPVPVPDCSQDEIMARAFQDEEQEAFRRRNAAALLNNEFSSPDTDHLELGDINDLADMLADDEEDDNGGITLSRASRERRARIQRDLFGDDEEEEMWDFNGTEWVKVPADLVIRSLGEGIREELATKGKTEEEEEEACVSIFPEDLPALPAPQPRVDTPVPALD